MGSYVARRLLQTIPVFLGATFLIYAMVFMLPGDPIQAMAGERRLPEATIEALHARYNLDDGLVVQYLKYLGGVLRGDLGESFTRREVSTIIAERLPVTLRLAAVAFVIQVVLGVAAGILAGLRRRSFVDSLVLVSTIAVISIPVFVLGYLAQLIVGVELGWLPIAGVRDGWRSFVLPGLVLASTSLAYIARLLRTSLAETLQADYIRTARAKGLTPARVVGVHALRPSMIPVVTFLGFDLGALLGGAIITEGIFNLPGIGGAVFDAIRSQDTPIVVGVVTFLVLVFIVANLLVDLVHGVLDPRVRHG